jgi:hypothetical protein
MMMNTSLRDQLIALKIERGHREAEALRKRGRHEWSMQMHEAKRKKQKEQSIRQAVHGLFTPAPVLNLLQGGR